MKLSKKHWLLYNYNYVFNKPRNHINRNLCDLFWGGVVLFIILIPFTFINYIYGRICKSKLNEYSEVEYDSRDGTGRPILMNIARIGVSIMIFALVGGLFYILPKHLIEEIGIAATIFIYGSVIGVLIYHEFFINVVDKGVTATIERANELGYDMTHNIWAERWKSFKEKRCPIVDFEEQE
jgi:uncharacterized BrkB/YihY/UPF0761 family membrane protein